MGLVRGESRYANVAAALESIADQIKLDTVRRVLIKPNFVSVSRQLASTCWTSSAPATMAPSS